LQHPGFIGAFLVGKMTEEDRATVEMDKEVSDLELRLIFMEQGYIHDYLKTVDKLRKLSTSMGENPENSGQYEADWRNNWNYLETMYEFYDLQVIPEAKDTEPYLRCKKIFDELVQPRLRSLSRNIGIIETNNDVKTTLGELVLVLGGLCEESRKVAYDTVLRELRGHPGYEDREKRGIWVTHPLCSNPGYTGVEPRAPPLPLD